MDKETPEMCKAKVWPQGAWHSVPCSRKAKRDGYCGTHHPEAKKRRDEKSRINYEKQLASSPHARIQTLERELNEAKTRIKVLEGAIDPVGLTGDLATADTLDQIAVQTGRHGFSVLAAELRDRTNARRAALEGKS